VYPPRVVNDAPAPAGPARPPAPAALVSAPVVDTSAALGAFLETLEALPGPRSLDTEADSFHHYFEKVCLLQIEAGGLAKLVDPLAVDIRPLLERLAARELLMHGADYDLRLLYRGYGFRARSVFDTMIAAQLLGEREIGLNALLQKRVGVSLDKAHQRADWSGRPLGPDLVAYAASDVLHLPALVASLSADLARAGRLAWHEEECARLAAGVFPSERATDPENDWRLKGTNAMTDRERSFVRALWGAREARARSLDLPPFRVLTNERLLAAASLAATGEKDPARLFPGPRPLPAALWVDLRDALERARALPPADWPKAKRGERVESDPRLEREVERLKKRRDLKATALALDPGVLASRATLNAAAEIVLGGGRLDDAKLADGSGISRWRAEILSGAG
jgi:ribonuclease D